VTDARKRRAIAIAEEKTAEREEHTALVQAAHEAERAERERVPVEPPELSGGLNPDGIGEDDGRAALDRYLDYVSSAKRSGNVAYYPSRDETWR
jgi:hypothetical protein